MASVLPSDPTVHVRRFDPALTLDTGADSREIFRPKEPPTVEQPATATRLLESRRPADGRDVGGHVANDRGNTGRSDSGLVVPRVVAIVEIGIGVVDERPTIERSAEPRASTERPYFESSFDEWCVSLPLSIGTVASVVGGGMLLARLRATADWTLVAGCIAFSMTLLAIHLCSTLSQRLVRPRWKRAFRILDQWFLFLLIVGTYTPVAALYSSGGRLAVLFWVIWCLALVGFLGKTVLEHRVDGGSMLAYVVLGWLPMLAAHSAWQMVPRAALVLLAAGAVCYAAGLVFFLSDRRGRSSQTTWHLFVLAGSTLHFYAVILCVTAVARAAGGA
jgi:hemolysin III